MRKLFAAPLPRPDLFLAGILLLALALRVWGLGWGLPSATHYFSYHPDESVVLETATSMSVFTGHLLPHFYNYGSLQLYLVCFANTLAALFGGLEIVPKDFASWYPQWAKMYLIGRWLTVSMGVGTVWAVFAIGKCLWGRPAGLLAALVLAITPLHAQHSHFLTVDVPATFWAMLSLLWAVRLATGEPKVWKAALWAGVFAGFAAATKYNLALIVLPLLAACFVRGGLSLSGSPNLGRGNLLLILTSLAASTLAFLVTCPGAVLESGAFLRDLHYEAVHVQNVDDPTFRGTGNGFVYQIARNLSAGLGLPLLLLTLVSIGYAALKRERGDGLLATFALPYFVLISLVAVRYARYDIPLLPILALWNGRLLADGSRISISPACKLTLAASAAVLLWTLGASAILIRPMAAVDPRDAALEWLLQHSPPTARIGFAVQPWFGAPPISPYFSSPRPGAWQAVTSPDLKRRIVYNGKDWDTELLKSQKPDFVVLSEYDYDDAKRLNEPAFLEYANALDSYNQIYQHPFQSPTVQGLHGPELISQNLPHDMLYTNPEITIYRKGLDNE
jgi:4-amino-4-deoxy-L-arabinose transferase-like glycosyltransferase